MQGERTLNDLWSKQWKIFTKGEFGFVLEFIAKQKKLWFPHRYTNIIFVCKLDTK
jgi:hypothetical protein